MAFDTPFATLPITRQFSFLQLRLDRASHRNGATTYRVVARNPDSWPRVQRVPSNRSIWVFRRSQTTPGEGIRVAGMGFGRIEHTLLYSVPESVTSREGVASVYILIAASGSGPTSTPVIIIWKQWLLDETIIWGGARSFGMRNSMLFSGFVRSVVAISSRIPSFCLSSFHPPILVLCCSWSRRAIG
ncbi:hypothetical protein BDV28DRAFT_17049 [Aspergillus coremiiformis]|uniref:Uncharacterized protein n=1 Tax=Aspergillus coremiiformis TaxID=138285 RepID=A0A5N6ZEW6_9EURO|nr:hypothetical protein BDV28DRAFT_17049 [Aspergillus coremiiformis]